MPRSRGDGGGIAEIAIGRKAAPVLVAAVEQIEQDRAPARSARECPRWRSRGPVRASKACTPRAGVEPEGRAAGQHDGVDPLDRAMPARAARFPACRAPPPRTSTAATAGSSNTTAVTPEARRASSACPTRTPATSVMRLRCAIWPRFPRDNLPARSLPDQITPVSHPGESGIGGLRRDADTSHLGPWPPMSPSSPRSLPAS